VAADGRVLPFRSRVFTKAYCSAVIHTLPSRSDGLRMIEELVRVCRPGGEVLVASVPDARQRFHLYRDTWSQAGIAGKVRLVVSLAIPRPAKAFLRAVLGLPRVEGLDFLDYDLPDLRRRLEAQGLQCELLPFPPDYWSRDFRRLRTNLLIRIPLAADTAPGTRHGERER
jgi:SAM-dependent methyltransferase